MIRSVFATLAAFVVVTAAGSQGCAASGVGDPCIPEQEFDKTFLGFDPAEVNVESKSFQCLTRLCLVNHFRGRVTCPYGQDKTGTQLPGTDGASSGNFPSQDMSNPPNDLATSTESGACLIPGGTCDKNISSDNCPTNPDGTVGDNIIGDLTNDPTDGAQVHPQCLDCIAANTVYCSCRCANAAGATNDGANYCSCPDGFTCTQLISPVGIGIDPNLIGAYCIKKASDYDPASSCETACDPSSTTTSCAPPPIR